jgi:hypothetical protein
VRKAAGSDSDVITSGSTENHAIITHMVVLTAHGLSQLLGDALQVAQRDLAGLVVVEQVEHLLYVFPRVLVTLKGTERRKKRCKEL